MSQARILLADNDLDFLDTCGEFLESCDYRVLRARGVDEARRLVDDVHLAILDLRLADDEDEKDVSGLALARDTSPLVPKIILTRFQTWQMVREALGATSDEPPPAVYFVAKQEGLPVLLQHVRRALEHHVRLNLNLHIDWTARDRFSLVSLIEPGLPSEAILQRADALEDVLRRLFRDKDRISLDRLLWQAEGRLALAVTAVKGGAPLASYVVVCGRRARLVDEARCYRDFAPQAPGLLSTVLAASAETVRLAAHAYVLAGVELDNTRSLSSAFHSLPDKASLAALETLFQHTLSAWRSDRRIWQEASTLEATYRARLGLDRDDVAHSLTALAERVEAIIRQARSLEPVIERLDAGLAVRAYGRLYAYPDPVAGAFADALTGQPIALTSSPGRITGDNVLTDGEGRAWLTDFADAGFAPELWNFVTLEAAIRFDWVEERDLRRLHDLERCLTQGEFKRLDMRDVEPALKKSLRAIQVIREQAARAPGFDRRAYSIGILFHAISRIARSDPDHLLAAGEMARLGHVLMAAAMECKVLAAPDSGQPTPVAPRPPGITIDKAQHAVSVAGKPVALRGQSYDILCYLHDRAPQLCSRRDIVERVFGETYVEQDQGQASRLNTAMGRLRAKLEPDPDRPRYLMTEPGVGYRLVID